MQSENEDSESGNNEPEIGGCACGLIQYTLDSQILNVVNCHCKMCKNHNGSPFSTYVVIAYDSLEITQGNQSISVYKAGSAQKHFCGTCGTPLFSINDKYPGVCMIYLGTLQSAEQIKPKMNIWCENKLPWLEQLSDIYSVAMGFNSKDSQQ